MQTFQLKGLGLENPSWVITCCIVIHVANWTFYQKVESIIWWNITYLHLKHFTFSVFQNNPDLIKTLLAQSQNPMSKMSFLPQGSQLPNGKY